MIKTYDDLVLAVKVSISKGGDDYDIIARVSRKEGVSLSQAKMVLVALRKAA